MVGANANQVILNHWQRLKVRRWHYQYRYNNWRF